MSVFLLAMLAITAPDSSAVAQTAKSHGAWNQAVLAAFKDHAQSRNREPAPSAAKLADVARKIAADKLLPDKSRRRLIGQIQRRLVVSGQPILAQRVGLPGAARDGVHQGAESLKELIEQTIEPSSWDVNGGPGHIHVFRE